MKKRYLQSFVNLAVLLTNLIAELGIDLGMNPLISLWVVSLERR
jgi:hypothetical protein